jgi:hypothetical protein
MVSLIGGAGVICLALAACGSSSAGMATTAPAAPVSATTPATPQASASTQGGAASPLPFNSAGPEPGAGGNDGPDATLPQGKLGAAAVAAGMGTDGNLVVTVTSTDTTCVPDKLTIPAGKVWFKLASQTTRLNEMYLETTSGTELIEVEKVKTGQFGAFKATVKPGTYVIACEPGMADQQVFTGITVTG